MMFGPDRFDLAGEEFLRIVQEELAARGHAASPDDVARLLGLSPDDLWVWLDAKDGRWLTELVLRWNAHADGHVLARVVLVDHGDEVELFLGHPLRPEHHHT